jgi:hypothetical protein
MFRKTTISTKRIAWFLLIVLLPLTVVAYLAYANAERNIRQEVTSKLLATADSKARQIETYLLERRRSVTTLSQTPSLIEAMEKLDAAFKKGGLTSKDSTLAKVFSRANTLLEVDLSDFDYYQATNEPAAFVAAPVL